MKSTFQKTLALFMSAVFMVGMLAGCGGKKETSAPAAPDAADAEVEAGVLADPFADLAEDYDAQSEAIYDLALGEFNALYEEAKAQESVSMRQAMMAQAEAKLLESAVMVPINANGGQYSISRVAPNSWPSVLWGNDCNRFENQLVTTELISVEDRDELKALWAELKGTGTWHEACKAKLLEMGYELKDTYNMFYNGDPKIWDALATSLTSDSEVLANVNDGLVMYDAENVLQPALAESWEISDDGLTYTFHIRQGLQWVDSQGRDVAPLTAHDFVTGMQHMMDAMGGLEYLVQGIIVGATEYITGEISDFAEVGVKAVDDYTLEYTLIEPTSFFMTMLSYGVFNPMNKEYYESQGGKFGGDFDASAADYLYGKTPDSIAYCGPYVVTNFTPGNTIVYKANPGYWNAENIEIHEMTWMYDDNKDATRIYNETINDVLDMCMLNASSVEAAQNDGYFDDYAFVAPTDATSFSMFHNLNRNAFANYNDNSAETTKDDDAILRSRIAMYNVHFRRALAFAMDRSTYNAQRVGESLAQACLRNTYTPGTFVTMEEDVTVDINGTETTFPAGTFYGEIIQAQLDADGVAIKAWDPEADSGIGSSDGYEGWYSPENALAELNLAIEELAAEGVEISAENPICLDLPYSSNSELYTNRVNAYKMAVEQALEGQVIVNLVECTTLDQWYYCGYYVSYGGEANYDVYDLSGWGPDYGDPQTYLDTYLPDYAGIMTMCVGLY